MFNVYPEGRGNAYHFNWQPEGEDEPLTFLFKVGAEDEDTAQGIALLHMAVLLYLEDVKQPWITERD